MSGLASMWLIVFLDKQAWRSYIAANILFKRLIILKKQASKDKTKTE